MARGKSSTKAGGEGKRPKKFLDQSAALSLATSIAEQKSHKTAEKLAQVRPPPPERSPRKSIKKVKLKETKALLAAQISESKKAKNKRRKTQRQSGTTSNGDDVPTPPMKKSVSFA
ncbi:hypothetical protein B0H16DRAFT_1523941 [Mycena metata]|uniref:Uncharacterized protein n=1 Tax=Mycena metata TaxID=1033252 RepID=A0AAD7JIP0_9AGAR|nr:hypothetical protein B0H16DRAFT_1523941 [Mycena metata]